MNLELYFAHTLNTYDTPLEKAHINLVEDFFSDLIDISIEDPNQPHHQEGYEKWRKEQPADASGKHGGMKYFFEVVFPNMLLPEAKSGCVIQPFLDGRIGLGVAGEAKKFLKARKPVWEIAYEYTQEPNISYGYWSFLHKDYVENFIRNPKNGIFFVRKISSLRATLILDDDPEIVIPHVETRLRTWLVYNKEKRPYETAHLAPTEVYDGFYPEKN